MATFEESQELLRRALAVQPPSGAGMFAGSPLPEYIRRAYLPPGHSGFNPPVAAPTSGVVSRVGMVPPRGDLDPTEMQRLRNRLILAPASVAATRLANVPGVLDAGGVSTEELAGLPTGQLPPTRLRTTDEAINPFGQGGSYLQTGVEAFRSRGPTLPEGTQILGGGPRSGGVTFSTPVDASTSPIIAQYERLQERRQAEELANLRMGRERFINQALQGAALSSGDTPLGSLIARGRELGVAQNLARLGVAERGAEQQSAAQRAAATIAAQGGLAGRIVAAQAAQRAAELGLEGQRARAAGQVGAAGLGAQGRIAAAQAAAAARLPTTDNLIAGLLQSSNEEERRAGADLYTQRYGQAPQVTFEPGAIPGQGKVAISERGKAPRVVGVEEEFRRQEQGRIEQAAAAISDEQIARMKPGDVIGSGVYTFQLGKDGKLKPIRPGG